MQITGYNCKIMDATRGPMGLCVEFTAASEYKDWACKDHIRELTSE